MENTSKILTVSELTREIKQTLEESFTKVSVVGEISNFKSHVSGHWYFNLKDADAVINCTMWKGFNQFVFFTPQDGMKVIVNGRITVYPQRGSYQLDVRSMKPEGVGELQEAFERLKKKMEEEGLFDEKFKKSIPTFPKKIGIVTAVDGAAFKDMISVAERRFPLVELVITPARVQGSGAAKSIAEGIKLLNQKREIDVIIIGRGGGSIEDLWAFNEEIVAREIFKSKIPIISGVGHEVDFTIADYVADLRAPTPSVAMELVTPNVEDIFALINEFSYNAQQSIEALIEGNKLKFKGIINSYGFRSLPDLINRKNQALDNIISGIQQNIDKTFLKSDKRLAITSEKIKSYNIERALKRGFVLVKQNSKFVIRANDFKLKKRANLQFFDGEVQIND
jgi:exodeoxyribonuclease VII large subunit